MPPLLLFTLQGIADPSLRYGRNNNRVMPLILAGTTNSGPVHPKN